MDGYTVAWIMWIVMFFAIEIPAVIDKDEGDTLSEHIRKWFSISEKGMGWRWRRIALLAFLSWLTLHLLTGWV